MRKGFTLVEFLAVLVILGLLIIITIPAYTSIYNGIKRQNLHSKITEISTAAKKYGETIKDEIKNAGNTCYNTTIEQLIRDGYLVSDVEKEPAMLNPTNNEKLDGDVKICYCKSEFDIEAYYTTTFNPDTVYFEGDMVVHNGVIYECMMTYEVKTGINSTNGSGVRYFKEVKC